MLSYLPLLFLLMDYVSSLSISPSSLSPFGECFDLLRPAFIRHAAAASVKPLLIAKTDMVTCGYHCRRNSHPSSDTVLPCRGFNFRPGRNPICEFVSMETESAETVLEPRQLHYYFEKTCLKIPSRCEEAAFALDAREGVRLRGVARERRRSETARECIEACFLEECPAFEWNQQERACFVYSTTKREAELERAEGVIYYENNCLEPSSRCASSNVVSFFLARRSDVPSFGVSVGTRTVRNCMRECIETTLFHCRSFQLDSNSQECFVSDESSEVAVPSVSLDLYEPFCLPAHLSPDECNRPYSFEKILTTRMKAEIAKNIQNIGVESCLSGCLALKGCRSVNYDVATRNCQLMRNSRADATIGPDENFDFYEVACAPIVLTPAPPTMDFSLVAKERTLRMEFRHLHNKRVSTLHQCWHLCASASFRCETFSFSPAKRECILSSTKVKGDSDDVHSQRNLMFDLFGMNDDGPRVAETESTQSVTSSSRSSSALSRPTTLSPFSFPTLLSQPPPTTSDSHSSEDNIFTFTSAEFEEKTVTMTTPERDLSMDEDLLDVLSHDLDSVGNSIVDDIGPNTSIGHQEQSISSTPVPPSSTSLPTPPPRPLTHSPPRSPSFSALLSPSSLDPPPSSLDPSPSSLDRSPSSLDPSPPSPEIPPHLAPPSIISIVPSSVTVEASCHQHGINVTFHLDKERYSGAVYAAERFEQCRVFVESKHTFSIFVPRPKHNTWCNAIELNNSMSVMLIMSNDRILPYDVTTVNDLFYHVQCDYENQKLNKLTHGIVVGGPSPIAIPKVESRSIGLRITRKGQPVESVFIGETLVARVESHLPPSSLRVVDCSAIRVGGKGKPASVHLIADGCALLPSLMSSMILGDSGWEATLSAFRIDGSEHVDIVCMVAVCQEENCPRNTQPSCPPTRDRSVRSLAASEPVRVDTRLRVRPIDKEDQDNRGLPQVCVQPLLYLSLLLLLFFSIAAASISLCTGWRRRNIHQRAGILAPSTLPENIGQKYMKTVAL